MKRPEYGGSIRQQLMNYFQWSTCKYRQTYFSNSVFFYFLFR